MSINRARKEAAKRLGLALEQKYRNLVLANPHDQDVEAERKMRNSPIWAEYDPA